jgi:hypothetical protein
MDDTLFQLGRNGFVPALRYRQPPSLDGAQSDYPAERTEPTVPEEPTESTEPTVPIEE